MTKLVVLFEILRTRLKSGEVADIQFENMFYCLCCVLHSKTRETRSQSVLHIHMYTIFKQNSVEMNTYYGGSLKIHVLLHCVNCARLYDRPAVMDQAIRLLVTSVGTLHRCVGRRKFFYWISYTDGAPAVCGS